MSLSLLRPKVKKFVRDEGAVLVDPDDYDLALQEAAKRYSRAKPKHWVADIDGNGGYDYDLPEAWDDEYSRIEEVEYPAGGREPLKVDALDFTLYRSPGGTQLRLLADTPDVGETVRLSFTGLHTIEEEATTVPASSHDALVLIAAALSCEQLASYYSNDSDPNVLADTVDHKSKASDYAARAQRFMKMANELLPIGEQGEITAAGGETSWGDDSGVLTHPLR